MMGPTTKHAQRRAARVLAILAALVAVVVIVEMLAWGMGG